MAESAAFVEALRRLPPVRALALWLAAKRFEEAINDKKE